MIIPDMCYALNNMKIDPKTKIGKVIRIDALEKGYYPTPLYKTQEEVDDMNLELGVTRAVAKAMVSASMFGWDCYKNVLESYTKEEEKRSKL